MKKVVFFLASLLACSLSMAQESEEPKWGIKLSGFVNTDYFVDSRQVVCARQGHFLLWPAPEKLDPNGDDINAKYNFNLLSIRTRVRGTISGPDALGAKTSAVIEGSFFGHSNLDLNEFRLRHAFFKMNWETTELIIGQTWHPMFITSCFPAVNNFNTGAPFTPFSRNPQIRLTKNLGAIKFSVTALAHADFYTAAGIAGLRNSGLPELHLQAWYNKPASEEVVGLLLGGGAGIKRIIPLIETDLGYKTSEGVTGLAAQLYGKLTFRKITIKAEGAYGQNNYDVIMLGSYATTSVDGATGIAYYTPTANAAGWFEIHSNNPTWQPGLFAGYSKNLGAGQDISVGGVAGSRGDIDFAYRISPRLNYNVGKMRFGIEVEYTVAAFGTINRTAGVDNAIPVGNFRTMLSAFYFF